MEIHNGTDALRSAESIRTAHRYPRSDAPRSPMKIFAGGKLNRRNPSDADATTRLAVTRMDASWRAHSTARVVKPIAVIPPANPSIPSMKLYRLTTHVTNSTVSTAPAVAPNSIAVPGRTRRSTARSAGTTHMAAARWNRNRTAGEMRRTSSANEIEPTIRAPASTHPCRGAGASMNAATVNPAARPASIATPPARETGRWCNDRSFGESTSHRPPPRDTIQPVDAAVTANAAAMASAITIHPSSGSGRGDPDTTDSSPIDPGATRAYRPWRMMPDTGHKLDARPYAVVFGATSVVGRHLARRLAERGFEGVCFSRRERPARYEMPPDFAWRTLSEGDRPSIPASAIVFSLAPISALPALLGRTTGASRLIALSTSSVYFKAESSDPHERHLAHTLKRAEIEVRSQCRDRSIAWTIFRPTLVYDPGHDRNITAITAFVRRFGVFPVAWPGTGRRQPIHADDVAQAMVAAAGVPEPIEAIFDLPGGETLTYRTMVRRTIRSSGRRPVLVYLPLGIARAAFRAWRGITGAQYSAASLERMNMDLVLDPAPVREALGITCRPFRPEAPLPRRTARDRPARAGHR